MPRNKRPRFGARPEVSKKPIVSRWPTAEQSQERLSWRLGDMEFQGPWHWSGIKARKWREILGLLADLEKLTWGEATAGSTPRVKLVKVAAAPPAVLQRLQEIERDDIDMLVEVRMSARQRIWGVRRGNVCHLLWWDPEHAAWSAAKRHT